MTTYKVFELQPVAPNFQSSAFCINASGTLIGGNSTGPEVTQDGLPSTGQAATYWSDPATPQPIQPFTGINDGAEQLSGGSSIGGLNDSGAAVGFADSNQPASFRAFLYQISEEKFVDLGAFVPSGSEGNAINNGGVIAGECGSVTRGFIYDSILQTAPVLIGESAGYYTFAAAINSSGVVAGTIEGSPHGFLFANGALTDLGAVDQVWGISDSELVVGQMLIPGTTQAALCNGAQPPYGFQAIPFPPGNFIGSTAKAVNSKGDVVGACWSEPGVQTLNDNADMNAFIYTSGQSVDLNSLIPPNSGWKLRMANDINDRGQIVGRGLLNGQKRGFLLEPITRPRYLLSIWNVVQILIGGITQGGSGHIFINGHIYPIGPSGPPDGAYAQEAELLIGLASEIVSAHSEEAGSRTHARRSALELARARIDQLLAALEHRDRPSGRK